MFNHPHQCRPILLYNNLYPLNLGRRAQSVSDAHYQSQEYPPYQQPQEPLGHWPHPGYIQRILSSFHPVEQEHGLSTFEGAKALGVPVLVSPREVAEGAHAVVVITDVNANMNARLLEANRRPVRGVEHEAKEVVERVA
jgi:hypothetical protein